MRDTPPVKPVEWVDGTLRILDQRQLPRAERYLSARTPEDVAEAIRVMAVRGAPLLGIAAAYGMALAARESNARDHGALIGDLERARQVLKGSRPTAANIGWAVDRVMAAAHRVTVDGTNGRAEPDAIRDAIAAEAGCIALEDEASCEAIGRLGSELLPEQGNVLTHCNTGALATGGLGTAQGVIVSAHRAGKRIHVWVDETRPVLQGARLTAWELAEDGIPHTLIADVAAGQLFARGLVDAVVFGADRIAHNGDAANKIGSYTLSVLARAHGVPCYVVAPSSTIDHAIADGADIPIEERAAEEVARLAGRVVAPEGTAVSNPAFDVTPAANITAIVTEAGVHRAPFEQSLPISAL